jgi:hypothetical protein
MKKIFILSLILLTSSNSLNCMEEEKKSSPHPMMTAIDEGLIKLYRRESSYFLERICEQLRSSPSAPQSLNFLFTGLDVVATQDDPKTYGWSTLGVIDLFIVQNVACPWADKGTISRWLDENRDASLATLPEPERKKIKQLKYKEEQYAALFFHELKKRKMLIKEGK